MAEPRQSDRDVLLRLLGGVLALLAGAAAWVILILLLKSAVP